MGCYFHFSSFFGWKHFKLSSGLKSRFLFCLIFQFYLMYRLICQKPDHFLFAQMDLVSTFFKMFIVLAMYNFATHITIIRKAFYVKMPWLTTCTPSFLNLLTALKCRTFFGGQHWGIRHGLIIFENYAIKLWKQNILIASLSCKWS